MRPRRLRSLAHRGSNFVRDFDCIVGVRERPSLINAIGPIPCALRAYRRAGAPSPKPAHELARRPAEKHAIACHFPATRGANCDTTKAKIALVVAQGNAVAARVCANKCRLCHFSVAILPWSDVEKTWALGVRREHIIGRRVEAGQTRSPSPRPRQGYSGEVRTREGGRIKKTARGTNCGIESSRSRDVGELPSRSGLKEARCLIHPSSSVNAPPYPPEHVSGFGAGTVSALSDLVRC